MMSKVEINVSEYPSKLGRSYTLNRTISQCAEVIAFDLRQPLCEQTTMWERLRRAGENAENFVALLQKTHRLGSLFLLRHNGFTLSVSSPASWIAIEHDILEVLKRAYGFEVIELVRSS